MSFRLILGAAAFGSFIGCASVSTLKSAEPIPAGNCSVTVYSSLESAKTKGPIEELCLITGTSSGSFSHTVATAIEKHKDKACACGAKDVYVQAQDAGTLGTASVTLVGFRYLEKSPSASPQKVQSSDRKIQIERAKKCQAKGGIWLDGKCEIDLE